MAHNHNLRSTLTPTLEYYYRQLVQRSIKTKNITFYLASLDERSCRRKVATNVHIKPAGDATLSESSVLYYTRINTEFYTHAIKIHTRQPFEAKQNKSSNKNVDNYS